MIKRLLLFIVLALNINISFALNEGRYYSMSDSSGSSFVSGFLILIGIIVFIIMVFGSFISSSKNSNNKRKQSRAANRSQGANKANVNENYNSGLCYKCKGARYVEKKLNYGEKAFMACPHCYGYGKTISLHVKSQIADLERKNKSKSDSERQLDRMLRDWKLEEELLNNNCAKQISACQEIQKILLPLPNCPYCYGTGNTKHVVNRWGENYVIEKCEICNGTGYN